MKILVVSSIIVTVLALFLFSFTSLQQLRQVYAQENNKPCKDGYIQIGGPTCIKDTADAGWEDENGDGIADGQEGKDKPCGDGEKLVGSLCERVNYSTNDYDYNDKSETNPRVNDPCNYYGLNVCDKSKKGCDGRNFDCQTDIDNHSYCTTGMCPGDDIPSGCWENQEYICGKDENDDIYVNSSDKSASLNVYVNLYHNSNDLAKLCLYSLKQSLGCKDISLSSSSNPYQSGPWIFDEGIVPVGDHFAACVTNLVNQEYNCVRGTNSLAKVPENVSIIVAPGPPKSLSPDVLIDPTCGPATGFDTMVAGKGFKPHSSINCILVGSDGRAPLGGYFESDDFGSLNTTSDIDSKVYDSIPEGHYKMEVRDDADEDYKLDSDGSNASVDVTIPCP